MTEGRRCYEKGQCPFHPILQEQVNKALPRWVFVSAFGTMITLSIIFASWHVSSLAEIDRKYEKQSSQGHITSQQNRELLIELRTNQIEMKKKIDRISSRLDR